MQLATLACTQQPDTKACAHKVELHVCGEPKDHGRTNCNYIFEKFIINPDSHILKQTNIAENVDIKERPQRKPLEAYEALMNTVPGALLL